MNTKIIDDININIRFVNYLPDCTNENHKLPWRRLYDYEIIYVVSGQLIVKTDKKTFIVKEKELHIMSPFIYHTRYFLSNSTCTYYSMHLDLFHNEPNTNFSINDAYISNIKNSNQFKEDPKWLKRSSNQNIIIPYLLNIFNSHQAIKCNELFKEIYECFNKTNKFKNILLKAKTYELIYLIFTACNNKKINFIQAKKSIHQPIINNYFRYVENNYENNIDIKAFCEKEGISQSYFSKIFKSQTGLAVHSYLLRFRIDKAKELLASSTLNINEIAQSVGFEDVNYFCRLFKIKEGISPSKFFNN